MEICLKFGLDLDRNYQYLPIKKYLAHAQLFSSDWLTSIHKVVLMVVPKVRLFTEL